MENAKKEWIITHTKSEDACVELKRFFGTKEEMEELLKSMVAECDLIKALGFDGEATRKMRAFLQGPKPELLHHQKFFENGTAERAKESGTEQNYNMIDGCVNNVPKKPRRIGGRWSVLERLHIKQAER